MKKTLNRIVSAALAAVLLGVTTGCSAFRSFDEPVIITCTPPDAVLMVNGQRQTPPAHLSVRRNRDMYLLAQKEGYLPYQRTVGNHFNATGALDLVGTFIFLLPGIGLFFPGAWSLDETDIGITLYRK